MNISMNSEIFKIFNFHAKSLHATSLPLEYFICFNIFFNGSKEKNILSWYFPPASLLSSSHQNQRFSLIADYLSSLSDDWWSSHVNQDVANLPDCLHTCSFVNLNFVTDHKFWIENPSGDETFRMLTLHYNILPAEGNLNPVQGWFRSSSTPAKMTPWWSFVVFDSHEIFP